MSDDDARKLHMIARRVSLVLAISAAAVMAGTTARSEAAADCDAIYNRAGHGKTFYEYNPTYIDRGSVFAWPEARPEDEGLNVTILAHAINQLVVSPSVRSVLVARNGKLVAESYAHGGTVDRANNMHSASKSILSALVGIAIRDGHIASVDEKVATFLPEYFVDGDSAKAQITVAHLLTMSAGIAWSEDITEYQIEDEANWVHAILARPMVANPPGQTFDYSTGLTHVLSAVLTAATGTSTCDFAHKHLFGPIGITAEHWGRDPQGIYSGGYNLYMTPREMAAFGQLYLQNGLWQGAEVVPGDWINRSFQRHFETDDDFHYGYLWWLRELDGHAVAIAWGWGDQIIAVMPSLAIVVVVTTDTAGSAPDFDVAGFLRDGVIAAVE